MLITVSIDNIRNLSLTALFGSKLIFFFFVGGFLFLIPTGLIAAELTQQHTDDSGIYIWVKKAFGTHFGFLAIWLQWVNTLVWYPTTLSFIAGSLIFSINPHLAQNPWLITMIIIITFWLLTIINLRGLNTSAHFASICAIIGLIIPLIMIIGLATYWAITHHPIQPFFQPKHIIPSLHSSQSWVSIVAIITSFLGMELISVHASRIHQASKRLPKAIIISSVIILVTMLAGSLAVAAIIPAKKLSLVAGIMQEFHFLLQASGLLWLQPIMATLIIIGALGSMVNWIISPAQGLLQASADGYLPKTLHQQNRLEVPSRILILQAILVTISSSIFILMPNINSSYWLLSDLSTELYLIMYTMMFIAAIALYVKNRTLSPIMQKIGGKWALYLLCILGLVACFITLFMGFIPPNEINTGPHGHFSLIFTFGLILMLTPCLFGYYYWHQRKKH